MTVYIHIPYKESHIEYVHIGILNIVYGIGVTDTIYDIWVLVYEIGRECPGYIGS